MVARVVGGLGQLVHRDVGRGQVGVAEAEVDDVPAGSPRHRLEVVDGGEHIGRQPVDPAELHRASLRPARAPLRTSPLRPSRRAAAASSSTSTGQPKITQRGAGLVPTRGTRSPNGGIGRRAAGRPRSPRSRRRTAHALGHERRLGVPDVERRRPRPRASSVRPADPPATHTVRPAPTSSRPRARPFGPAFGRRSGTGCRTAAVLLLRSAGRRSRARRSPVPGPGRSSATNCAGQHRRWAPGRHGPPACPRKGPSAARRLAEAVAASAPSSGKGASAGRSGWPMRPDVVVTEHPVDAGLDRLGRGGERRRRVCRGTSAARRRCGSPEPPCARRQRAPTAPARSPNAARHDHGRRPARRRPRPARRTAARAASISRSRPPPPRPRARNTRGRRTQARLARPKPIHQPTSSMTRRARRVAGRRRGGDVLAAHALGVAAGQPHHLAEPAGQRGLAGQHARARRPRRSAPNSRGGRRGTVGRRGRRPCARSRRRSLPHPTWTRSSTTTPPPMPVPSVTITM